LGIQKYAALILSPFPHPPHESCVWLMTLSQNALYPTRALENKTLAPRLSHHWIISLRYNMLSRPFDHSLFNILVSTLRAPKEMGLKITTTPRKTGKKSTK